MSLASMTGFARAHGAVRGYTWVWEIKSVNSKGLDLRLRLPPGWDAIEAPVRANATRTLARGAVSATLEVKRDGAPPVVRVNEEVLAAVLDTMQAIARRVDAQPPTVDGILGLKGVIEVVDAEENEDDRATAEQAVVVGFEGALKELVAVRRREGDALARILSDRIGAIEKLRNAAEHSPARTPDAIRARLAEQVKMLLETGEKFEPDRLHQEAVLLATKLDVREEIDRLGAHVSAARELLKSGGAVGRKLDFLAQEFNREANTLCSKANAASLTAIGLELKVVVDQFREQVQNLE
jgi:uncharacterized protein (TIGR00255 family)